MLASAWPGSQETFTSIACFLDGQVRHYSMIDRAVSLGKSENSRLGTLDVSLMWVFSWGLPIKTIRQAAVAHENSFEWLKLPDLVSINIHLEKQGVLAFLSNCWWVLIKMVVWVWFWNCGIHLTHVHWVSGENIPGLRVFPPSLEAISCILMLILKR